MDHSLPLSNGILNAELARLYEKRALLDQLILNLERYAEFEGKPSPTIPLNTAATLVSSQISGL